MYLHRDLQDGGGPVAISVWGTYASGRPLRRTIRLLVVCQELWFLFWRRVTRMVAKPDVDRGHLVVLRVEYDLQEIGDGAVVLSSARRAGATGHGSRGAVGFQGYRTSPLSGRNGSAGPPTGFVGYTCL